MAVKDSNGNILVDGDDVTVIKDLKVRGASIPLKLLPDPRHPPGRG